MCIQIELEVVMDSIMSDLANFGSNSINACTAEHSMLAQLPARFVKQEEPEVGSGDCFG